MGNREVSYSYVGISLPRHLKFWWQWGKFLGAILSPLTLLGIPVMSALAAHLLCDFTLQTGEMSARKKEEFLPLLLHSIIAGGGPGFVAGGLRGMYIGIVTHYMIDATNKFGTDGMGGVILDQAAHILVILAISWLRGRLV